METINAQYIADITIDTETTIQELSELYYIQKRLDLVSNVKRLDYGAEVEQKYDEVKKDFINHGAYYHRPYISSDPNVYGTWNNGKRCGVWAYINNDAECTLDKLNFYDKEGNLTCEIKNMETGGRDKSKIIRVIDYTDGTKFSKERFTITRAYILALTGSTESWLFRDDLKDYIPGMDEESSEDIESKLTNLKTEPDELPEPPKEIKVKLPESKDESDDDILLIL